MLSRLYARLRRLPHIRDAVDANAMELSGKAHWIDLTLGDVPRISLETRIQTLRVAQEAADDLSEKLSRLVARLEGRG
jgi:hypothetical protein